MLLSELRKFLHSDYHLKYLLKSTNMFIYSFPKVTKASFLTQRMTSRRFMLQCNCILIHRPRQKLKHCIAEDVGSKCFIFN
jgi:hypothetical protein